MATQVAPRWRAIDADHRFFFISSWVMAAVIVAGFSTSLAFGRSSFGAPLVVHVHAFVFFGWLCLYLLQNGLVAAGNVKLHRQLGWLAVGWLPAMLVMGVVLTIFSLRTHGGPPFFDANEFLIQNPIALLYFVGMAVAAIVMRRRTAWHRRLMFCGMAMLTGPGSGRILPMPLFIPWGWWVPQALALGFQIAGMIADKRRTGRVHPAYWWGAGLLIGSQVLGDLIAYSPLGISLTHFALAGTPFDHADWSARSHFLL
jgi:hypothetical protein